MDAERSLAKLFLSRQDGAVALSAGQFVSWAQFCSDVAGAASLLHNRAGQRVALYEADSYRFSVWLFAAWQSDCCVCLPGDNTPHTQAAMLSGADFLLGELPGAPCWQSWQPALSAALHALDPDMLAVAVFTSGSTGEPLAISKYLRQLDHEVQTLEAVFASSLSQDTLLLATVSHQHLYGLLFRILWPLLAGRCVANNTIQFPEELLALHRPWALIASPAFLRRMPAELAWESASPCQAVFSSGGPLPAEAGELAGRLLRCSVFEIYGSSETGGIAWRSQVGADWQLMPDVAVQLGENECLAVRSPCLPDDDWFQTADRVALGGNSFRLLGRADRIVKLEEKRISLTALEAALQSMDIVQEARCLLLSDRQRSEMGAVLVLNPQGLQQLQALGKFRLGQQLREQLASAFERVALPRRWRFVEALPCNSMGKTTENALQQLFIQDAQTRQSLPHILSCSQSENRVELELELQPEIVYFDGHFPEFVLLPGVAQLEWVMHYAREYLRVPAGFVSMDTIKFQQILLPGSRLSLSIEYQQGVVRFQYRRGEKSCSSGRIRVLEEQA